MYFSGLVNMTQVSDPVVCVLLVVVFFLWGVLAYKEEASVEKEVRKMTRKAKLGLDAS